MQWCDALSTELVSRVCFEAVFLWDRRTIREAGEQRERAGKFPRGRLSRQHMGKLSSWLRYCRQEEVIFHPSPNQVLRSIPAAVHNLASPGLPWSTTRLHLGRVHHTSSCQKLTFVRPIHHEGRGKRPPGDETSPSYSGLLPRCYSTTAGIHALNSGTTCIGATEARGT